MRFWTTSILLLVAAGCRDEAAGVGRFAFASSDWDDGKAVVSVFRDRWESSVWTLEKRGRRCVWRDEAGEVEAEYAYDADGFLESLKVAGAQEFRRIVKSRMYYWKHTDPSDEKRLVAK